MSGGGFGRRRQWGPTSTSQHRRQTSPRSTTRACAGRRSRRADRRGARGADRRTTAPSNGRTVPRHDAVVRLGARLLDRGGRVLHRPGRTRSRNASSCVGQTVANEPVRPARTRVGQTIKVNGSAFQVVGVLKRKGANGVQDQDDIVIAPLRPPRRTAHRADGSGSARSSSRRARERSTPPRPRSRRSSRRHTTERRPTSFRVLNQAIAAADARSDQPDVHRAARRGGRHLAARRRHRRDEHHARHRHRAHPRDRHPQGDRRPAQRHPRPVPHRGR